MFIRPEQPGDRDAVRAVHDAAFTAPDGGHSPEALLVDRLRADGDLVAALSLVAEVDGEVVGHVAVSRGTPDGLLGIAPLAVHPDHQGRGVGSALMHSTIAAAEALWHTGLVLLGDPAYYERFGFVPAATYGLAPEADWPLEAFQARPLPSSWTGGYPAGTVFRYAPAIMAM